MKDKFSKLFETKLFSKFSNILLKQKKKYLSYSFLLFCMILFLVGILKQSFVFPATNQNKNKPIIVLDAGHGGADPGRRNAQSPR